MLHYLLFIPEFARYVNSSLFLFRIAELGHEFRNYLNKKYLFNSLLSSIRIAHTALFFLSFSAIFCKLTYNVSE